MKSHQLHNVPEEIYLASSFTEQFLIATSIKKLPSQFILLLLILVKSTVDSLTLIGDTSSSHSTCMSPDWGHTVLPINHLT